MLIKFSQLRPNRCCNYACFGPRVSIVYLSWSNEYFKKIPDYTLTKNTQPIHFLQHYPSFTPLSNITPLLVTCISFSPLPYENGNKNIIDQGRVKVTTLIHHGNRTWLIPLVIPWDGGGNPGDLCEGSRTKTSPNGGAPNSSYRQEGPRLITLSWSMRTVLERKHLSIDHRMTMDNLMWKRHLLYPVSKALLVTVTPTWETRNYDG